MKKVRKCFMFTLVICTVLALVHPSSPYTGTLNEIIEKVDIVNKSENAGHTSEKVFSLKEGKKAAFASETVNDPLFNSQWYIYRTESSRIWPLISQKRGIRVAVVDTGVDYNHPDLKNRVLRELGYDFYNEDKDPMDDGWHGTHIAGIIAAEANNGIGIAGIVGELDVKIIPVKVLNGQGFGAATVIARGIRYSVDMGADIINLSVDFDTKDEFIADAIRYAWDKGVFVVVSAGNNNKNCDFNSPTADFGAYAVAAVDATNEKTYFSSFGKSIRVSAPGQDILSTVPGGIYAGKDGTSMAAPMVTGIAAMLKAHNPSLSPAELAEILTESSVQAIISVPGQPIGKGLVNAYNAFAAIN
jgi:subtilisin family serine protease